MGIQESNISNVHTVKMLRDLVLIAVKTDRLFLAYLLGMALTEVLAATQNKNQ